MCINQVFLDFLSQLRAGYIDRDLEPTFKSVILAGVYDIKNLKHKLRNEDEHKYNSPWNITADFNVDMSFSQKDIDDKKSLKLSYKPKTGRVISMYLSCLLFSH